MFRAMHLSITLATKWVAILFMVQLCMDFALGMCPSECFCSKDASNRFQTICNKGGLRNIPVEFMDNSTQVLIVHGPSSITIGPIFNRMKQLEELKITDSNVPSVGVQSFWGLEKLRILDLSRNNITMLIEKNFYGQQNLLELDLSQNRISSLFSWVFQHLLELRRLNLADNSITKLAQRVFYRLNHLEYLDLSRNPFNELSNDVFKDVMKLKQLRCRNCNIKEINPEIFQYILNLRVLDFGNNQITNLNKTDIVNCPHLTTLKLDGNHIKNIPHDLFHRQLSLEHLDLSWNQLESIEEGVFHKLSNFTHLDISYNILLDVPEARELTSLQTLNISGNKDMHLYDIFNSFEKLNQLETLSIADMGPMPVRLLLPVRNIKALNLSGNHLLNTSLDILGPVIQLELLDLSRNLINGFNRKLANRLQQITNVILDNNPFICDRCHMGSLIDIARYLTWDNYPVCMLPESLYGTPIIELNPPELEWCMHLLYNDPYDAFSYNSLLARGNINIIAIIFGVIFTVVAVVILISFICLSRHRARYYTHEDKLSDICIEKSMDTLTLAGNEINFKFPVDDKICTVDELILPPPPPPPPAC